MNIQSFFYLPFQSFCYTNEIISWNWSGQTIEKMREHSKQNGRSAWREEGGTHRGSSSSSSSSTISPDFTVVVAHFFFFSPPPSSCRRDLHEYWHGAAKAWPILMQIRNTSAKGDKKHLCFINTLKNGVRQSEKKAKRKKVAKGQIRKGEYKNS